MVEAPTTNVFMLIDSDLIRIAVRQIIDQHPACRLVGEASDTEALLDYFEDGNVDVVIVKRSAVRQDLISWVERAKSNSSVKVLFLLGSLGEFFECASSGADGYMLLDTSTYLFPVAIRVLHEGGCWLGPMIAKHLLSGESRLIRSATNPSFTDGSGDMLTTKEREVMRHLCQGISNAEIAANLELSIETVRVHVRNILRKLGVRDRKEAIAKSGQFLAR